MRIMAMPFLVNAFQGIVDFFHFWRKQGQVPTGICGDLFSAVNTGVLFDMGGDLF